LAVTTVLVVPPARAGSGAAPAGSVGHDVSYPQCAGSGSTGTTAGSLSGAFGIVGVTNGLPFSASPCWAAEYAWAAGRSYRAGLYANTANPAPRSSHYWPVSDARDPALCANSASTTDPGCAYDYGWHAAASALATAQVTVPTAATLPWWLDVESANSWNGNGTANAADLQGAVDLLRSKGVARVGLYSTAYQWRAITGGYAASSAATYRAAWRSAFTPRYRLETLPLWIATTGDLAAAKAACSTTFTGAPAQLVQYVDGSGIDANYVCRRA